MSLTAGDDVIGDSSHFPSTDWDDKKVRHTFIRKASPGSWGHPSWWGGNCQVGGQVLTPPCLLQVYAIISLQLLVTVGIIAVFTFV